MVLSLQKLRGNKKEVSSKVVFVKWNVLVLCYKLGMAQNNKCCCAPLSALSEVRHCTTPFGTGRIGLNVMVLNMQHASVPPA